MKRLPEKEKDEGEGESDKACDIQHSSRSLSNFRFHTQQELQTMYGKQNERKVEFNWNLAPKKPQPSKVKEGISQEEREKSEGYRLFKKALDAHIVKREMRRIKAV